MREFKIFLLFLFISGLLFCSKNTVQDEYPVVKEKIDDVQVVTNPNYPRDGIIRDILEEELSIGLIEGPDEYMLNRPFDVRAADDGTIFVLDWGDVNINAYDKEGTYLRTIGQKGQGPGDFGFLLYMALSSDGRIYIMNPVNRQVAIFSMSGEYLGG
ncbi:MAG: 6-bladed beta-propeller, partial [Candidatus Aminicenantes bacterium]|nr:6-bladed beta-propeller [Candidatus Aminicenantes bacterium]